MRRELAIFDFDGTLTNKDSFLSIIFFSNSFWKIIFAGIWLSPYLIGYKFGFFSNHKAKEKVFSFFFKGWSEAHFNKVCADFALKIIPSIIKEEGWAKIKWHIKNKHEILILTASVENWVCPWATKYGIKVIGTKAEISAGILQGKFDGKNCNGIEKVLRLKSKYDLTSYDYIYSYGNSRGDEDFMKLAHERYYKKFL